MQYNAATCIVQWYPKVKLFKSRNFLLAEEVIFFSNGNLFREGL